MEYRVIRNKKIALLLAGMCMMGTVAGCTPTAESTESEQPTDKKESTTSEQESVTEKEDGFKYQITEEGITFQMPNAPTTPAWLPSQLLESNLDEVAVYNKSTVALNSRIEKEKLQPVNSTQKLDTEVAALSIMNSNTSGNIPHGSNKFEANTFSYWQYIDKMVYWGGSAGEGIIVPPTPDVTDSAHKNGVPVLGTIFFPPLEYGGKEAWVDEFLQQNEAGEFIIIDKLIEACDKLGFDGWFINQETQLEEATKEMPEYAVLFQEFIKQFKAKAGHYEIMWYDAMTVDGEMDWQNQMNEKNKAFAVDEAGNTLADSMFLNFWWTTDKLGPEKLLEKSNAYAESVGYNPKKLFAGIDMQSNGTGTPIKWDLLEKGDDVQTSIGLYCPSWSFFSAESVDQFQNNEARIYVNEFADPSKETQATGTEWRGLSKFAVEKSVINEAPFRTNFNMGNGYNFFIGGEKVSALDWNNRSLADIMPTYRWIIKGDANKITPGIDYANAYYGGNSLKFLSDFKANETSTVTLFSSDLKVEENMQATITATSQTPVQLNLVLGFEDGTTSIVEASKQLADTWEELTFDLKEHAGKTIKTIGFDVTADEDKKVTFNVGEMTIKANDEKAAVVDVSNVKADDVMFVEEDTIAGVHLSWDTTDATDLKAYEIYNKNPDGSHSLLGTTRNNRFFINSLERGEKVQESEFVVRATNQDNTQGASASVKVTWPDNTIPKADFTASKTVVAPNEEIVFNNLSNKLSETFEWTFEGATVETSTEQNPTVSYANEGTYNVKLVAKNAQGEHEMVQEGLITVTAAASEGTVNFALNQPAEASSFVNNNEAPAFAIDGDVTKKWCAVGQDNHNITIDLGEVKNISMLRVHHAEAGGENPDMNTEEYTLEVSTDGTNFETVLDKKKSSAGVTEDAFKAVPARYVRFTVLKPTQGSDSAARIYEIEVHGLK